MSAIIERDPFEDLGDYPKGYVPSAEYVPDPKPLRGRRRRQTSSKALFNKKVREYWESQGYRVDRLESWQNVNGAWVQKDFCGCFDLLATKKDSPRVLIQVSTKGDKRKHWRKMLSNDEYENGKTRRKAVEHFRELGDLICIQWFDQPGGVGTKWIDGIEWLSDEIISDIDTTRRKKGVA